MNKVWNKATPGNNPGHDVDVLCVMGDGTMMVLKYDKDEHGGHGGYKPLIPYDPAHTMWNTMFQVVYWRYLPKKPSKKSIDKLIAKYDSKNKTLKE